MTYKSVFLLSFRDGSCWQNEGCTDDNFITPSCMLLQPEMVVFPVLFLTIRATT